MYAIHVAPGRYRGGVGRALLRQPTRRCAAAGHDRMFLRVLKENRRAPLHEASGFRPDGTEEPFEVDGVEVPEAPYVRDLTD